MFYYVLCMCIVLARALYKRHGPLSPDIFGYVRKRQTLVSEDNVVMVTDKKMNQPDF